MLGQALHRHSAEPGMTAKTRAELGIATVYNKFIFLF